MLVMLSELETPLSSAAIISGVSGAVGPDLSSTKLPLLFELLPAASATVVTTE